MSSNGIASAEDFKRVAEQMNPPERVILPKSGLAVLLRRPTTLAVCMMDERLAALEEAGQVLKRRDLLREAVVAAVVQPRLSLQPGPGEIHPNDLLQADQTFIVRWVRGYIAPDGTDLVEEFFRESGESAGAGAGGEGTEHTAVEDPGVVGAVRDAS
jgi:hypothetical protein